MAGTTLQPGDWVPQFTARTNATQHFTLSSLGGRYVILSFLGTLRHKAGADAYAHVIATHQAWLENGAHCAFLAVISSPEDIQAETGKPPVPGMRTVFDPALRLAEVYGRLSDGKDGKQYAAATFVLDPMLRLLAIIPIDDRGLHNAILDKTLAALPPREGFAGVPSSAPVLVLPRIFEPEFCQTLIRRFEADGGRPSGFMRDLNGVTAVQHDEKFKRRSDWVIEDVETHAEIRDKLGRRLLPGVRTAFQFAATHIERYLVACYDGASGGFFKPHRDNTTKGTAHRRFAVTINLNAEDYDGGDLRFPEYGERRYRAPTGGAVVFACSVLHEACPVTRGRRYAFLPFLFDDAGETLRLANLKYVTAEVPGGAITDGAKVS